MGRPAIGCKRVLEEIDVYLAKRDIEDPWRFRIITEGNQTVITLKEFRRILMIDSDLTTSERKVKELWNQMLDFDFFTKINQSDKVLVNLAECCRALGYRVYTKKERDHLMSKQEEGICQPVL